MKIFIKKSFLLFIVLSFVLISSILAYGENGELFIPEFNYSYLELDNGLQIYVFEDHHLPLVNMAIWYKVGSIYEEKGKTGISHVLEHNMFLGTDTLEKDQVHHLIKIAGGVNNAATSYDFTKYHVDNLPSAKLELAMAIEADRMRNLLLDKDEFVREIDVVKQERRMRIENNFAQDAMEKFQATAFKESPLHHQVIGWIEDLNNLNVEDVQEYYNMYYAPNNAVIVVSGDANPEEVFRLAKKYYGAYQAQDINIPIFSRENQEKERHLEVKKITQVPYIVMYYKIPAGNHQDKIAIDFLMEILVNNSTSRIKTELEKKQQICLYSAAGSTSLAIPGFAQVILVPSAVDNVDLLKNHFDKELEKLIENGISDQEIQIVKKKILKGLVLNQRDIANNAEMLISGLLKFDQAEHYKQEIQQINDMTKEDIVRVAKKYFIKEHRTIGYILPDDSIGE